MAWSTTPPELPSGSEWTQVGTTTYQDNNTSITSVVYCARLSGKGFALKVEESRIHIRFNFTDLYLRCDIGGVTGEPETGIKGTSGNGSTTAYFVGEAAAGVQITVTVSYTGTNYDTRDRFTFTAPDLLGATVFLKVGGVWKPAQVKVKVGGVWRDAVAKIKVGGTWK